MPSPLVKKISAIAFGRISNKGPKAAATDALTSITACLRIATASMKNGDLDDLAKLDLETRQTCGEAFDALAGYCTTGKQLLNLASNKSKTAAPQAKILTRSQFSALATPGAKMRFFQTGGRLTD